MKYEPGEIEKLLFRHARSVKEGRDLAEVAKGLDATVQDARSDRKVKARKLVTHVVGNVFFVDFKHRV
jgi:hypothetical protein